MEYVLAFGRHMHDGGPGFFGWFFMLLLIVLAVALIVAVLTRMGGRHGLALGAPGHTPAPPPGPADGPLELLRLRYARGEIDRDAFLQANRDLGGAPPPE